MMLKINYNAKFLGETACQKESSQVVELSSGSQSRSISIVFNFAKMRIEKLSSIVG